MRNALLAPRLHETGLAPVEPRLARRGWRPARTERGESNCVGGRHESDSPRVKRRERFAIPFVEASAGACACRSVGVLEAIRPRLRWRHSRARVFDFGGDGSTAEIPAIAERSAPVDSSTLRFRGSARWARCGGRRVSIPLLRMQSTVALESEAGKPHSILGTPTTERRCWFPGSVALVATRELFARAARQLHSRSDHSIFDETACADLPPRSDARAPNFPTKISSNSQDSRPVAEWRACFPLFDPIRRLDRGDRISGAERNTVTR